MNKIIRKALIISSILSISSVTNADDTNIYFPESSATGSHNVLFIMDVSGSMNSRIGNTGVTRFRAMKSAFNSILDTMPSSVNVGLMNFGSIGPDRWDYGQGVKFPITSLTANARKTFEDGLPLNDDGSVNWNANNMPEPDSSMTVYDYLPSIVNSWSPRGWTPLVDSLYEAALYYRGDKVSWGLGPLEEAGNEWVSHPSTYTGSPGEWDSSICNTVWTERLPAGEIPLEYRCPSDPDNLGANGSYANCAATAHECTSPPATITSSSGTVGTLVGSCDSNDDDDHNDDDHNDDDHNDDDHNDDDHNDDDHNDDDHNDDDHNDDDHNDDDHNDDDHNDDDHNDDDHNDDDHNDDDGSSSTSSCSIYQIDGSWENADYWFTSSDNPVYEIVVTERSEVTIRVTAKVDEFPFIWLLNEDGGYINSEDSWGFYYSSVTQVLDPGVYQVVAATYYNNKSGDFTVEASGAISSLQTAGNEGSNSYTINGNWTNASGGQDYASVSNPVFGFTVENAGNVAIELDMANGSDDAYLYLLDSDGSVVWQDGDTGGADKAEYNDVLVAGTYTIVAATTDSSVSGAYVLNISGAVSNVTGVLNGVGGRQVAICHTPTGNIDNSYTLVVDQSEVAEHLAHGDDASACGALDVDNNYDPNTCEYTMCSGGAPSVPTYISPIKNACQSNTIILLSDGYPQSGAKTVVNPTYDKVVTDAEWTGVLPDIFRNLNCEDSPSGLPRGRCGPELTHYLAENDNSDEDDDQFINTYTVGFGLSENSAAESYLESLSTVDDVTTLGTVEGYYSASDQEGLITAFTSILSDLQLNETSTAFANPGYSVVTKTGLNHEDSIFVPTFKVGDNAVWEGNLKKFKLVNSGGSRLIQGKNNQNAVTELGAFTADAHDYWSTSDEADGVDVRGGGVASKLNPSERNLYVDLACTNGSSCDLTSLNNELSLDNVNLNDSSTGISNSLLGLTDASVTDRKKYVCFIRGYEEYDPVLDSCSGNNRKHMGDMLHFEPIVVTYDSDHDDASDSTHKQVIFAGTNEGYLHAFDADSGEEVFAFMPKELLKNIKPQFDDNEFRSHQYGVDGYANIWLNDIDHDGVIEADQGDHVYLYFGLRRGGSSFYALDITDPNSPELKWKVDGGGDGDFQYLGESWSKPYLANIHTASDDATLKKVVIFSGGYDSNNQDKPLADRSSADSVGNDVLIVDANTGEFIWSIKKGTGRSAITGSSALTHSIPGGLRILDVDRDGAIDRMYFADVGGNVWRLELDTDFYDGETDANPASKYDLNDAKLIKMASLGGGTATTEPRKFFNEPDVSITRKDGITSLLVSVGSGDRTKPLSKETVDRFYVLIDRWIHDALPNDFTAITESNLAAIVKGVDDAGAVTLANPITNQSILATANKKGWYFQFSDSGEKVLSDSLTNHGKVIFTTLVPDVYASVTSSATNCNTAATQGRAYVLDILTGKAVVDLSGNGGAADNNDLSTVVSANEIPGSVQVIFNEPLADDGSSCSNDDCVQNVDVRSGKKLSEVMSYNAAVLESVFWSKPQGVD